MSGETPSNHRLIESHLSYAHAIAAEIVKTLPIHVERGDFRAAAELGLTEAAHSYDHRPGVQFKTFAYHLQDVRLSPHPGRGLRCGPQGQLACRNPGCAAFTAKPLSPCVTCSRSVTTPGAWIGKVYKGKMNGPEGLSYRRHLPEAVSR
jgi:hypothetical protein